MRPLSIFLLTLYFLIYTRAEDSSEEKTDSKIKPILEKFVKLVEDHKLNVTLFSTEDENNSHGQLLKSVGMASNFPPNHEIIPLTASSLTTEVMDAFLKLAQEQNITAYSRTIKIENGKVAKEDIRTKSEIDPTKLKPKASVYKWSTHVENGHKGFQMKDESYGLLTNFIVSGADGKNHTVTTVESHIEVKLIEKSSEITDEELNYIKDLLPKIQLIFNENQSRAEALVDGLNEKLPGNDWQVIINPEEYEVSSCKFVVFDAVATYLIFALNK